MDTDEVADKLTPDEVEDFRDAFEVSLGDAESRRNPILCIFCRFLTRMATVGSAWPSWVR